MGTGCLENLEKALFFAGIGSKGAKMIMHEGDISSTRLTGSRVLKVVDAKQFFDRLRCHVPSCPECLGKYVRYLDGVRKDRTIQEADVEYLGVLHIRYFLDQVENQAENPT